ncbi:MAG: DUF935 family protein, partial [Vicingaceae bacterium]|nr:DUF935 family protein [Vicingaceae bacterium]
VDAHLMSAMESRSLRLQRSKFAIYNESTGEENEELTKLFQNAWFINFMNIVMLSVFRGTQVVELFELNELGELKTINTFPQKHIKPEKGLLLKSPADETGWNYKDGKLATFYLQLGNDDDLGILSDLAPVVLIKKYAIASWSDYTEKFGIPPRYVKTTTTDPKRLKDLELMMQNMISSAWAILQGDEELMMLENTSVGGHELFDRLIMRMNSEISKRILGQDGTSDNKDASGTFGSLKVLQGVANDRHESDKYMLKNIVNTELIPRLKQISQVYSPLEGHYFDWDDMYDLPTNELIDAVTKLGVQYEIDPEYITQKTGIPILGVKQTAPTPFAAEGGAEPGK